MSRLLNTSFLILLLSTLPVEYLKDYFISIGIRLLSSIYLHKSGHKLPQNRYTLMIQGCQVLKSHSHNQEAKDAPTLRGTVDILWVGGRGRLDRIEGLTMALLRPAFCCWCGWLFCCHMQKNKKKKHWESGNGKWKVEWVELANVEG